MFFWPLTFDLRFLQTQFFENFPKFPCETFFWPSTRKYVSLTPWGASPLTPPGPYHWGIPSLRTKKLIFCAFQCKCSFDLWPLTWHEHPYRQTIFFHMTLSTVEGIYHAEKISIYEFFLIFGYCHTEGISNAAYLPFWSFSFCSSRQFLSIPKNNCTSFMEENTFYSDTPSYWMDFLWFLGNIIERNFWRQYIHL